MRGMNLWMQRSFTHIKRTIRLYSLKFRVLITVALLCFSVSSHATPMIKIALGDNYGKHAMIVDGRPAGIQKDLLDWFFKEKVSINASIEAMPWKRAQLSVVEQKKADGYFTALTQHRVEVLGLIPSSHPFYSTQVKMHTWQGNPKISVLKTLSSLQELLSLDSIRHVFFRGHGYHEEHFKTAKNIHRTDSVAQIPHFLLGYKRADIFVEQSELFYPLAEEAGLFSEVVTLDNIPFKRLDWHLFIRPDSPNMDAMMQINEALEKSRNDGSLLRKVYAIFRKYGLEYSE